MKSSVPNISNTAFWDVRLEHTEAYFAQYKEFIVSRVFCYGNLFDIRTVLCYYGQEEVKQALLDTAWMDDKTLAFASALFNLNEEEFRCYKRKQSAQVPWPY